MRQPTLRSVHVWRYLATVMDLKSPRVISASNGETQLVSDALDTRGGSVKAGIIIHSDRDSTYTSDVYQWLISKWGMTSLP